MQYQKYASREEQALSEAGRTAISPAQKRLLVAIFLLTVFFVPVSQQVIDVRACLNGSRSSPVPQCYDIFGSAFSALKKICKPAGHPIKCLFSANRQLLRDMHAYENALEDNSPAGRLIRPSIQYFMTRWLGAGNDKTYCGRGQWLFYRPDIDYVINHGFLNDDVMKRRVSAGSETTAAPQPDPRPAIIAFKAELAARGIKLILMPTPVKSVIHPEKFAAGFENVKTPVQNSSYQNFIKSMENAGVLVFDPAQMLVRDKLENKREQFLAGDTHWRPEAMELCARLLSGFIRQDVNLTTEPATGYTAVKTNIFQRGDIVAMLRLPEENKKYGGERVEIRRIFLTDDRPWQPSKEADVLVLGDSFANIYSLGNMGWGANAGLVEQLSYEMQRPIDFITVNDNGAWAARELLMRELAGGKDRLAGKRAVIWQFAARELTEGDWKLISLKPAGRYERFLKVPSGRELAVNGEIKVITRAPRPGSVPYADHIITVHLTYVSDNTNDYGQALVYMFSMTNHVLTKAAGLRAGNTVSLRLRPWSEVSATYERINRAEPDDPELLVQEPCWGELLVEGK